MSIALTEKICELLLLKGKLSPGDMALVRENAAKQGGSLGEALLKLKFVTGEEYLSALAEIARAVPVRLSKLHVDKALITALPKRFASMYQAFPVSKVGKFMTVALADPLNIFAMDDMKTVTGCDINPVVADAGEIAEFIVKYYEKSADEEMSQIVEGMAYAEMEMVEEERELSSGEILKIMDETPVIKLTNMILSQGVIEKASDILVEPMENSFRVRYRIDGMLQIKHVPPKKYHAPLISRLKIMSNLNIAERRVPQDGRFQMTVEGRKVDFRLSVLPSIIGEKACLRILDKGQGLTDINRLGLSERDKNTIISAGIKPHGMILACGPTGSGKTTTLYSVLRHIYSPAKNFVTVEDPVEYELSGMNQVNINADIGLTFAGCLRSILRQDPDVILIGEIRDFETVDIAIKAALTGHLVLSTLHTNTAAGSVVRMRNMGVEPFLIASSVELFIAQRLARKLCSECKEPYVLPKEAAEKFGLLDEKGDPAVIFKPKGCPRCTNLGYSGRMVVVECLPMSSAIRELLFKGAQELEIEREARKEGMVPLRANGIESVLKGITSLEEILRITT
ncbi:MAG: Flp pilus assembly complex ATPase component TadA [Candidatus Omnitrophica bacterium]|nr:Flp pilus assembly complex ATPase component TadA [Candidatus Omnitrophota bacterium]